MEYLLATFCALLVGVIAFYFKHHFNYYFNATKLNSNEKSVQNFYHVFKTKTDKYKCLLRCFDDNDKTSLQKAGDDPRIGKYLRIGFPSPYTLEIAQGWIDKNNGYYQTYDDIIASTDQNPTKSSKQQTGMLIPQLSLAICCFNDDIDDGADITKSDKIEDIVSKSFVIGNIGIVRSPYESHIGRIGYWINPEYAGNGIATAALKTFIQFMWSKDNLVLNGVIRIEGHVADGNPASLKVLEKCGFEKEGILKKSHEYRDGGIGDTTITALIRKDHRSIQ